MEVVLVISSEFQMNEELNDIMLFVSVYLVPSSMNPIVYFLLLNKT